MSRLDAIPVHREPTAGTGNVLPLLHEIRHALERVKDGGEGTVIDLQRLPLAPGEEERIEAFLGEGEVRAEIDALGPTIVRETSYPGVWLVTHRNAHEQIVGRYIEVTAVPDILRSQDDDIEQGLARIVLQLEEDSGQPHSDA